MLTQDQKASSTRSRLVFSKAWWFAILIGSRAVFDRGSRRASMRRSLIFYVDMAISTCSPLDHHLRCTGQQRMTSIRSVARHAIRHRGREGSTDILCSQTEQETILRQWILIAGSVILLTTRQIWTSCSVAEWLLSNDTGILYCECGLLRSDSETAW